MRHEWYVPCDARDCSLWIDRSVLPGVERFSRCHMLTITPLVREIMLYLGPQPGIYGDMPEAASS